jgi:hypothetical protein
MKIMKRIIEGAKDKRKIIRWLCFISGIVLLFVLNLKYVFPWTDVYMGATFFYMAVLLTYVISKSRAEKVGTPYPKTWMGEWLGIAWLVNFIIMWFLRAILTAKYPGQFQDTLVVPEEMAWIAGETAVLFIFWLFYPQSKNSK